MLVYLYVNIEDAVENIVRMLEDECISRGVDWRRKIR